MSTVFAGASLRPSFTFDNCSFQISEVVFGGAHGVQILTHLMKRDVHVNCLYCQVREGLMHLDALFTQFSFCENPSQVL